MTEIEFFLHRSIRALVYNIIKAIALIGTAYLIIVIGGYYLTFPFILVLMGILLFKIYKNIKDCRILVDLCRYANSLDIMSVEVKEE
jgi:hypothetical protein